MQIDSQHYTVRYIGSLHVTKGPLSQGNEVKISVLLPVSGEIKEPLYFVQKYDNISIVQEEELRKFYGLMCESFIDEAYNICGLQRFPNTPKRS